MLKLQKKLKDGDLYYLIYNMENKTILDWFIFKDYKECPKLEIYFFGLMFKELQDTFNYDHSEYSQAKFLANLLIQYNILVDGNVITIKHSKLINEAYMEIRFNCLSNSISSFKNKLNTKAIKAYKERILNADFDNLLTQKAKTSINKINAMLKLDHNQSIIKEVVYLCLEKDYNLSLKKSIKLKQICEGIENKLNNIPDEQMV